MNESIRSHAYRRLNPLRSFQVGDQAGVHLPDEVQSAFAADEELLGIYRNSESNPRANLIFTTRGIYHFLENWTCLEYRQIEKANVYGLKDKSFDKSRADTFLFQLKEGQEVKIKVSGAVVRILSGYERRFPDLWEVDRFLSRVIGRIRCG